MNTILKIDEIRLSKLNNAEYTNFMSRTLTEVGVATVEKLGITNDDMIALSDNITEMQDLVAQSRISDDTARLAALDEERDNIVIYIIAEVDNKRRSPIAAVKEAATSIYNQIHVYTGIQNLPTQQETQQVIGFVTDCLKTENNAHMSALGLTEVVNELLRINTEYGDITEHRTTNGVDTSIENSKTVRAANDPIYDYIMTMAFVTSISTPSAEATLFIQRQNALIKETNTLYNLRTSTSDKKPEDQDEPSADPEQPTE